MKYLISKLPVNPEDFTTLLPEMEKTPEGAAAACVLALYLTALDNSLAKQLLRAMNPEVSHSTIQLAQSQLKSKPYLIRSYFSGTTNQNGYAMPEKLEIEFTTNKYSGSEDSGKIKFFTACSGADSPRPLTVKKGLDGTWYAHEWSSLVVGIRSPL